MVCFKKASYLFVIGVITFLNFSAPVFAAAVNKPHHPKIHHHKTKLHHTHLNKVIPTKTVAVTAVPAYYAKPEVTPEHENFIIATGKRLASFVTNTVATLHYSHYKLGGHHFDTTHGVYVLDCSNFVDNILREESPHAYSSLVSATGADTPSTQHYYDFFSGLNNDPDNFWNKINSVEDLHAGDILVFRNKNYHGALSGGHVMVVMETPVRDTDIYFVRVADSAPSRHSQDTRQLHKGGIGIGTLLLRVNPVTGSPSAYAWGLGSYWNKNVNFAMARPVEINFNHNA